MDRKIVVNDLVRANYESGMSLNEAIENEFHDEIEARRNENPALKNLTPTNLVMYDAGIRNRDEIGKIINQSTMYTSGGMEENTWLFPAWVDSTLHEAMYENSIINYLVGSSETVSSNIVKSAMLNLLDGKNRNNIKKSRVAEGADLPLARITMGEKAISLWKYGRALEMTYEAVRRCKIPLWNKHMQAIVNDLAQQNVVAAADVLLNGDGNNNAAEEIADLSDGLTNDTLLDALVNYSDETLMSADTIIATGDDYKKLLKMKYSLQETYGLSGRVALNFPQLDLSNLTVLKARFDLKVNGNNVILVFNRANTLIRYVESGSMIQEANAFIRNQTNLMTMSENSGYAISVMGANKYITTKKSS